MIVLASTARFKLATLVQYVPLPVVGGYLGYVGYFCLAAGIGLGTNTTIDTFTSWTALASQGGSFVEVCNGRGRMSSVIGQLLA
jgi:SulP family sulfate permease